MTEKIKKIKLISKYLLFTVVSLCLFVYIASFIIPFQIDEMEKMKESRSSITVYDDNKTPLRRFRGNRDSWTYWVKLSDINPNFTNALIAIEDKRFHSHIGVDFLSITRAFVGNMTGSRRSGASTLTMQCIRMLRNKPRTIYNKFIETFMALQLEHYYSKDEIIEWYCNMAPFGSNVYGIEAASRIYFNKSNKDLTLAESALLAALPQRPSQLRPDIYPEKAKIRRNLVLKKMFIHQFISLNSKNNAIDEKISAKKYPIEFIAPHFSRLVEKLHTSQDKEFDSTLDLRIQKVSESALKLHLNKFSNIHNGAIVVIENKTGAVKAMVGSNNFFDSKINGQINNTITNRSPGSALKPFIYAMAFENKDYLPATMINDEFVNFCGYIPQNYDKKYHGRVSLRESLVQSYNIPAVKLINQYGTQSFTELMLKCGITTFDSSKNYGLPIILGAAEIKLLELTSAYTIFPNKGKYLPYKLLKNSNKKITQVISSGSAYLVCDILKDTSRDMGAGELSLIKNKYDICWKTGTSYGNNDAWTISFNNKYTVGIWLGNSDGKPSQELVAIKSVAPLNIRILREISKNTNITNFLPPKNIRQAEICCKSGRIATINCIKTEFENIIDHSEDYSKCPIHKLAYKYDILKTGSKRTEVIIEDWGDNKQPNKVTEKLKIISPKYSKYVKLKSSDATQKMKFQAESNTDNIYWFINDKFYRETKMNKDIFWNMKAGTFKISCRDEKGNENSKQIIVSEL